MTFRKKAAFLSALVAVLALANILTVILDPVKRRHDSFAWLDPSLIVMADRIELYGSSGVTILERRNNKWVCQGENAEYPVKQARVGDLLSALSRKGAYSRRAASAEARRALALDEGHSSRVIVRGGAGLPLLDLLIGTADALGREVYLRKSAQNDIYSGEDFFTLYTESKSVSWYDLRLFPLETGFLTTDTVQQAEISLLFGNISDEKQSFILRREKSGWIIPGEEQAALDSLRLESWLRSVLEAEGDDFSGENVEQYEASITLRFGDGAVRYIRAGAADDEKRRGVLVSGSALVYLLSERTLDRIFRDKAYFVPHS